MLYNPPIGGAADDPYVDANPATGVEGSPVPAAAVEDPQREILAVIEGVGLVPSGADLTQLKQAITQMIVNGGAVKAPVRVASTAAINLAAPGATIDGVAMVAGDRFLEKDHGTGSSRGIYIWNGAAVPATRAGDADGASEIVAGMLVVVQEGTANADTIWELTTDGAITVGTTAMTFALARSAEVSHGQCRLTKSGANLLLSPYNGNKIVINGVVRTIPSAGVSLAPTGLAPGTLYFIYVYMNAGVMTLESSATGHGSDAATGVEIKAADATRTLVGMARPIGGPAWQDTLAQRFVVSWFNRHLLACAGPGSGGSTTSTTPVELVSTMRVEFIMWANEAVQAAFNGYASNSSAGSSSAAVASLDGVSSFYQTIYGTSSAAGAYCSLSGVGSLNVTEGYHYVTGMVQVSAGTGTYFGAQINGSIRG
jgi:hypothetical protein